jgi:hypothetical protein
MLDSAEKAPEVKVNSLKVEVTPEGLYTGHDNAVIRELNWKDEHAEATESRDAAQQERDGVYADTVGSEYMDKVNADVALKEAEERLQHAREGVARAEDTSTQVVELAKQHFEENEEEYKTTAIEEATARGIEINYHQ